MDLLRKKQRFISSGSLEMKVIGRQSVISTGDKVWSIIIINLSLLAKMMEWFLTSHHWLDPPVCLLPSPWARSEVICCCSLPSHSRHTPLIHFTLLPPLSFSRVLRSLGSCASWWPTRWNCWNAAGGKGSKQLLCCVLFPLPELPGRRSSYSSSPPSPSTTHTSCHSRCSPTQHSKPSWSGSGLLH